MQCKCGGYVRTKVGPIVKNKKVVGVKELDVCEACLRNAGPIRFYSVDRHGHRDQFLQEGL